MRFCVDATPLLLRSGGVKNYVYYWLQHLLRLAEPGTISLFPFLDRLGDLDHEHSHRGTLATLARLAFLHLANEPWNPVLNLLGRRYDLFHASNVHVLNPPRNTRLTATLYDLSCWLTPETHLDKNVRVNRRFGEVLANRADGVIAISESTKRDAMRILGLRPEKVEVIYPGIAGAFFEPAPEAVASVKSRYGLPRPYLLYVGTVEPRKNLDTLLDAYERLSASLREEFDFVLAGPVGWHSERTVARIRSGIPGVRFLGYVPERDLPALTAGAAAFAYPSLYEGFGFPVAQAMAAGIAVIASNLSSLPEITGDAALLVDPQSVEELRSALERLLESPSLRAELAGRAKLRARAYNWEDCARRTLEFFRRVTG